MTEKEVTKLKDNGEKELEMERDVQKWCIYNVLTCKIIESILEFNNILVLN